MNDFEEAMVENFGKMTEAQKMVGRWSREWCEDNLLCNEYKYCNAEAMVSQETLRTENQRLREALEYIVSKKHFVGKPKWDAELVSVAKQALAEIEGE